MTGSASFVAGVARGNDLKVYNARTIRDVPQVRSALSEEALFDLEVVSTVIPFRTNNYVVDELIDWDAPFRTIPSSGSRSRSAGC